LQTFQSAVKRVMVPLLQQAVSGYSSDSDFEIVSDGECTKTATPLTHTHTGPGTQTPTSFCEIRLSKFRFDPLEPPDFTMRPYTIREPKWRPNDGWQHHEPEYVPPSPYLPSNDSYVPPPAYTPPAPAWSPPSEEWKPPQSDWDAPPATWMPNQSILVHHS